MENKIDDIKCINCQNHAKHEKGCIIDSPNYNKSTDEIKECFILGDWLKSLDRMTLILDKMLKVLNQS